MIPAVVILATVVTADTSVDPITAILSRDWAAVGGWSLFISLVITILTLVLTDRLVAGSRLRKAEGLAEKQAQTISDLTSALKEQTSANQIVQHFFQEVPQKRGELSP
jgi:hypothetical protein